MKISIITLCRNSEQFIEQTINSVMSQNGIGRDFQLEYIFVYAKSSDHTLNIINEYQVKFPDIVRIIEDEGKGICHAMNTGIDHANGDVVAHLHSDDFYNEKDVLRTVAGYFEKNTKCKWLYSSFRLVDENNCVIRDIRRSFKYGTLKKWCIVPHPTTFIRKELFQEFGMYNSAYKLAMDYDYWLRISQIYRPYVFKNRYFSSFRVHTGSATEKHAQSSAQETKDIANKYKFTENQYSIWEKIIDKMALGPRS